ncbi:hypothetical protein MKX01_004147 [Papaver californicum]|nr:hypothetical protein MKX01_004147 [Papaver californicum]
MQKLFDALGPEYSSREDLVVCSDRSQNIEEAVIKVFPGVCHVYCAYHLKNFHNVAAAEAFMRDVKAYTDDDYRKVMSTVKKDKEFWARIHAKSHRFTLMTTNICESCNDLLLKARTLPIIHLVDFIRSQLMGRFYEHRDLAMKSNYHLSDYARNIIKGRWDLERILRATKSHDDVFQVDEVVNMDQHVVRMKEKSCTCWVFKLRAFSVSTRPCSIIENEG